MNRYIVSAVAMMASAGVAFAQTPKGQDAAPPSAKSGAPGQMKPDDSPAKSVAPGQTKESGSSASDEAPGRTKTNDRREGSQKDAQGEKSKSESRQSGAAGDERSKDAEQHKRQSGDNGTTKSKSAEPSRDETTRDRSKNAEKNGSDKGMQSKGDHQSDSPRRAGDNDRGRNGAAARVDLKPEQKTKVITTFKEHRVAPVKDIHVNISVGTVVPKRVELHPIPRDIIVIVPAYERYKYFVFEDKIIIVEPVTYEIVDVLDIA
ncbi:MAG: DUF1236 domain-containing protein [Hyphomicrobiaceae bacterium]